MKTLLLGFSDIRGRGQSALLAGPEVEARNISEVFTAAKSENKFPKGITRLEIWGESRGRTAVAICVKANAEHENKIAADAKTAQEANAKDEEANAKQKNSPKK